MNSIVGNLKHGKDFLYSYPRGFIKEPQIQVINGKYKGLVIDLWYSAIISVYNKKKSNNRLDFKYSIVKVWDSIKDDDYDGTKIIISNDVHEFLSSLVSDYILEISKTKRRNT